MLKRVFALLLACLLPLSALAEAAEPMDTLAAIAFAQAFLERAEIAGDAGLPLSVNRDDDCWVCENTSPDAGCLLIFDDTGRVHLFRSLSSDLPELPAEKNSWAAGVEELAGLKGVSEASAVLDSLLTDTRGYGYDVTGVSAQADEDTYLLSLDNFSGYALIRLAEDGLTVLAYGDLTASHGAYGSCLSQAGAVAAARQAASERYGLQATDVHLSQADFEVSDPARFSPGGTDIPLPYWFVVFREDLNDEESGEYSFLIDGRTGGTLDSADPEHGGNG